MGNDATSSLCHCPFLCYFIALFLIALKALHCGTTGRAGSLYGVPAIFHRHFLRILYLGLLFALYTVRLSHFELLSSLQQSYRYVLHYASQGISSARFLFTYTCWGNASDTSIFWMVPAIYRLEAADGSTITSCPDLSGKLRP